MAVNQLRKATLACVTGALLTLSSCGGAQSKKAEVAKEPEAVETNKKVDFSDQKRREGRDTVVVLTPFSSTTESLWRAMRDEVSEELDVVTLELSDRMTAGILAARLKEVGPQCVVLIGNRSARLFGDMQRAGTVTPPGVVLMSSFAEETVGQLRNTTGIAYEVPAVTSLVTLRRLYDRPLKRVGVLYRPAMKHFVDKQTELAKIEHLQLVSQVVEGAPEPRKIRLALRKLMRREKVDALLVLNDNQLLTPAIIRSGWLPEVNGGDLPVVVGVDSLVNVQLQFGSVAVVPDHEALGVQAANLLFDLLDAEWQLNGHAVDLPLSVKSIVDMTQGARLNMFPEAEATIDRKLF